jgi:predicted DNA-binding transcriptional regulator AlpA
MSLPDYISGDDILARFKKSRGWLWEQEKKDSNFPKPIYVGGEKFYSVAGFNAWLEHPDRRKPPRENMPKSKGRPPKKKPGDAAGASEAA